MTVRLDVRLPDHVSDETAAMVSELLWQIISAWDGRYFLQLRRYHDSLRLPANPDRPWETLPTTE